MKKIIFLLLSLSIFSCGTSVPAIKGDIIRQAQNTPDAFIAPQGMVVEAKTCKSPMIDPRTGLEINLIRSQGGVGDYKVPDGQYGLKNKELLRLYCETGKIAGVVKK